VQAAQKREIDAKIFKYAGVAGIDKPRIVQVGYRFTFLDDLAKKVGLARLVAELVAGGTVVAIRVVDPNLVTLAYSAVRQHVPPEFDARDEARLREVIARKRAQSYLDGPMMTIMVPSVRDDGGVLGATVVHVPADSIYDAIRQKLTLAGLVAAGVLSVGLLASILLARRVTGPVSELTAAAAAVERHAFEAGSLTGVTRRSDELGHLARVFHRMALEVQAREQRLRQEVQQLRIEIDEARKQRQVEEITDTEYFQNLRQRAQSLRGRTRHPAGPVGSGSAGGTFEPGTPICEG
jgi:methyl-accepting chemotaxis protein